MENSVTVQLIDLGVTNGMQTWEVVDVETGETIGYNQTAIEETP